MALSPDKNQDVVHDHKDLARWHAEMSRRERLELAFALSRTGDQIAKAGREARSRGR